MRAPQPSASSHATPPRQRALLVISAQPAPDLPIAIAAGREPRRDYYALRDALDADLLFRDGGRATRLGRLLARYAGPRVALAYEAFRQRTRYDAIYTDGENLGLPFAALLAVAAPFDHLRRRRRARHIMLTHYLSSRPKRLLFRLGLGRFVERLIVHSAAQYELATTTLRMPGERVVKLPYFADEQFWRPQPAIPSAPSAPTSAAQADQPMICAVGLEFRDYTTLVAAVRDTPIVARIAAGSAWSHHSAFAGATTLPPNVTVQSYTYQPLRDLYTAARIVVVPLHDVDNQAGITVILEAMAMGKALIVSGTRGQTDVIRDRRNAGRGRVARPWRPAFLDAPADTLIGSLGALPTGFYVAPGDAAELRRAILYLLAHPDLADEMGRNGRHVVEALFSLDAFAARFAAVIRGDTPALIPTDAPTLTSARA